MKKRYYEQDFNGYVGDLIESGRLNETEAGIAKRMQDKGYDSLSDKQKSVFDNAIEKNSVKECNFCGNDIPWDEMLNALDNGNLCSGCQRNMEKIDEE